MGEFDAREKILVRATDQGTDENVPIWNDIYVTATDSINLNI